MALELRFDLVDLIKNESRAKRKAFAPLIKQRAIKVEFGNRCIDEIKRRTLAGEDKNGKTFKGSKGRPARKGKKAIKGSGAGKYSQSYRESLAYTIYGKTNKVNLKLTGEMHAHINVLKVDPSGVIIGIKDSTQEKKARGHINGSGYLPIRDFWGLSKDDQTKILKGVLKDFNDEDSISALTDALADAASIVGTTSLAGEKLQDAS